MNMVAVILLTLSLSTGTKGDADYKTWNVDVLYRYVTYSTIDQCLSMLDGEVHRLEEILTTVAPHMRSDHTIDSSTLDNIGGRCIMVRREDL